MTDAPLYPSHESLNFNIPPGKRLCFYEDLTPGSARKVEAFVLAGGDMEITLNIYGPLEQGDILQESFEDPMQSEVISGSKEKTSDSQTIVIDFDAPEQGSYAFCLDNRSARFFPKFVQFDVSPADAKAQEADFVLPKDTKTTVDYAELESTLQILQRVNKGIANIRSQQHRDRHRLNLHTTTNANNYTHAFYGSLVETVIFIVVALFQIYFVRRWFASKNPRKAAAAVITGADWA